MVMARLYRRMKPWPAGGLDPREALRVTTSFGLGRKHIAPALSLLAKSYPAPDITLDRGKLL